MSPAQPRPRSALIAAAIVFGLAAFGLSWWRWWTYQYQTFDLAFYVQALWLTLRGAGHSSLLGVPLLGNHAEPIVYLLTPLFAICPHPMLLPAIQIAALSSMPFIAHRIARRAGFEGWPAVALALATLLAPASGFVAIHEFHPEAFSAPLLLLLYKARQKHRIRLYVVCFALALACKENIALLLVAWSVVHLWNDRRRNQQALVQWYVLPGMAALLWLLIYAFWLSPALNGGRVDYGNLYSGLGATSGEAVANFFTEPGRFWGALWRSSTSGNLLWASVLSSAGLVLLRPRWLLIAAPVLLQHLLSWRASEWSIGFHYAAPLIALFWLGALEACAAFPAERLWVWAPAAACLLLQPFVGFGGEFIDAFRTRQTMAWNRSWKAPLVDEIAARPEQDVLAGMPYLSHLAKRPGLHSLHLVLKGVQTLSLQPYEPDFRPDVVLIDYADTATFNYPGAYYHPPGMVEKRPLPSSDELLNSFLSREEWQAASWNELTVLRRGQAPVASAFSTRKTKPLALFPHTSLVQAALSPPDRNRHAALELAWDFRRPRANIPWITVELKSATARYPVLVGMAAPQAAAIAFRETRGLIFPPWIPSGTYAARAVFFDQIRAYWGKENHNPFLGETPLGDVAIP